MRDRERGKVQRHIEDGLPGLGLQYVAGCTDKVKWKTEEENI